MRSERGRTRVSAVYDNNELACPIPLRRRALQHQTSFLLPLFDLAPHHTVSRGKRRRTYISVGTETAGREWARVRESARGSEKREEEEGGGRERRGKMSTRRTVRRDSPLASLEEWTLSHFTYVERCATGAGDEYQKNEGKKAKRKNDPNGLSSCPPAHLLTQSLQSFSDSPSTLRLLVRPAVPTVRIPTLVASSRPFVVCRRRPTKREWRLYVGERIEARMARGSDEGSRSRGFGRRKEGRKEKKRRDENRSSRGV